MMRSMKIWLFITMWLVNYAWAEQQSNYQVMKLSEQVYLFTYHWAPDAKTNIGVVISDEGVLLINTMMLRQVDQLEYELAKLTDKPVKYVLNSNYDTYNTQANQYFVEKGATVISHRDTVYAQDMYSQILFDDEILLPFGREVIQAYHSGGHSWGHINIYLKEANVMFMADSFRMAYLTTLGPRGLEGHIDGLSSAISLGNNDTKYIPGNVYKRLYGDKGDLKQEIELRTRFYQRTKELYRLGLEESKIAEDPEIIEISNHYEYFPEMELGHWLFTPVRFFEAMQQQSLNLKGKAEYEGKYLLNNMPEVEVFLQQDRLVIRAKGTMYFNLVEVARDRFWYDQESLHRHFVFTRDNDGKVKGLQMVNAQTSEGDDYYLRHLVNKHFVKANK